MPIEQRGDLRILHLESDGPVISTSEDTSDLIGNAWVDGAHIIAVPVSRLDPDFFDLSSRIAGEIAQKIVNYQLKLAVIGDISEFTAASSSLADYVWETNRGEHIWFLPDTDALAAKVDARVRAAGPPPSPPSSSPSSSS